MKSIWTKTYERKSRPTLEGTVEADVAVIGAGITGILTAWQLEEAGVHAVVLEADQIGSGQTGNTTAKITSQHESLTVINLKLLGLFGMIPKVPPKKRLQKRLSRYGGLCTYCQQPPRQHFFKDPLVNCSFSFAL